MPRAAISLTQVVTSCPVFDTHPMRDKETGLQQSVVASEAFRLRWNILLATLLLRVVVLVVVAIILVIVVVIVFFQIDILVIILVVVFTFGKV